MDLELQRICFDFNYYDVIKEKRAFCFKLLQGVNYSPQSPHSSEVTTDQLQRCSDAEPKQTNHGAALMWNQTGAITVKARIQGPMVRGDNHRKSVTSSTKVLT